MEQIRWPMTNEQLETAIQKSWERARSTAKDEPIYFELTEQLRALLGTQRLRASMAETV